MTKQELIIGTIGLVLFFLPMLILMVHRQRQFEEELMEQYIRDEVQVSLDQRFEQEQAERERFQREQIAASRDAWRAVQEMVSTARDLAYMEQNQQ